jgi:hypothetical protein
VLWIVPPPACIERCYLLQRMSPEVARLGPPAVVPFAPRTKE